MTAETDLLPLPDTYSAAEVAMRNDGKWVRREDFDWHLAARGKIARANLADLQREVATWKGLHASEVQVRQRWQARAEALRAEVLQIERENREGWKQATHWRGRAERLAEALRELASQLQYADKHAQVTKDVAGEFICLPPWLWIEIRDKARAALEQESNDAE